MDADRKKSDFSAISIGPHLAYTKFMESIGADTTQMRHHMTHQQSFVLKGANFLRSVRAIPAGYKYYVSESCFYYPVMARRFGRISGKIIDLCASPTYYYLLTNRIRGVGKRILTNLLRDVDGFLFEGKFVGDVVHKLGVDKPNGIVYTYVKPERFATLARRKPSLKSKNVSIIATNDAYYKGLDILLEAMEIVNVEDPEITLTVIPKNIDFVPLRHLMTENVKIDTDMMRALCYTSLYVHPARGDVFPASPLEAMLGGIPTIVSDNMGTREVVEAVNRDFVVSPDPKSVAEQILAYFSLNYAQKSKLSLKFRNAAKHYNEKEQVANFKTVLKRLLTEV